MNDPAIPATLLIPSARPARHSASRRRGSHAQRTRVPVRARVKVRAPSLSVFATRASATPQLEGRSSELTAGPARFIRADALRRSVQSHDQLGVDVRA